ncbi:MAG TPA: pentapeptide repeat-containing protein [Pyrinomonadaceae bacterium]|jgi:uncharacterized protein YjbI with pentapeptide repeats
MSITNLGQIRLQGYTGNYLQPNYHDWSGDADFAPLMLPIDNPEMNAADQIFELHLVSPGVVGLWSSGGYAYVFAQYEYDGPLDTNEVCFYPQYVGGDNQVIADHTEFIIYSVGPQQIALKNVRSGMFMRVHNSVFGDAGDGDRNYHVIADSQSVGQEETFTLLSPDGGNPNLMIMKALANLHGSHFQGADLRGENLSGFNFSGADLTGADLTGATLSNTVYNGQYNGQVTPAILREVKFATGGGTTNLAGLSFLDCDLSGADLTTIDLRSTQLGTASGSTLKPTNLSGAIFNSENRHTQFSPVVNLSGVNLSAAKLAGCVFEETNLRGANLSGADLAGAQISGPDISGAVFGGATLNGVNLSKSNVAPLTAQPDFAGTPNQLTLLHNATISASLLGTNWSGLDLTGSTVADVPDNLANLNAAHTIFPDQFDLSGASRVLTKACFDGISSTRLNLEQANLAEATFKNARLYGVTMQGANLAAANFDGAFLLPPDQQNYAYNADLRSAYLYNAQLTNATLDLADFSGAHFYGDEASVSGSTTMQDTGFEDAILSGLDFSNATLYGTKFNRAQMINCKFLGATLTNVEFESAYLQGAGFATANVTSANFTGAIFAISPGQLTVTDGENKWTVVWGKTEPNADYFADNCTLPDGFHGPIKDNGQNIGQLVGILQFSDAALLSELSQTTFARSPVSSDLVNIFKDHNITLNASSAMVVRLSQSDLWRVDNPDPGGAMESVKLGAVSGQIYTLIGENGTCSVYLSVERTPYPPEPPCVPESASAQQAQGDHKCPPPPWPPS